jgi:AcrR family transcriptional regulator
MKAQRQSRTSGAAAPKPGRRAENKERTRQSILKAALDLFSRKGFARTATKEISAKANIAEGTLFNYFRTKEDLALYFLDQEITALIAWFKAEERLKKAPLPEQLFAIVHRLLERIEPYEDFIGAVFLRALQPGSRLSPLSLDRREINLRYLRFVQGILAAAEARGEIPKLGDLGAYGFALFQAGVMVYWLHDRSRGKENTLALLDRSLKLAAAYGKKGGWSW